MYTSQPYEQAMIWTSGAFFLGCTIAQGMAKLWRSIFSVTVLFLMNFRMGYGICENGNGYVRDVIDAMWVGAVSKRAPMLAMLQIESLTQFCRAVTYGVTQPCCQSRQDIRRRTYCVRYSIPSDVDRRAVMMTKSSAWRSPRTGLAVASPQSIR